MSVSQDGVSVLAGNHYGLGAVRQRELRKACLLLGVSTAHMSAACKS